jgi:signal peptidase I
MTIANEPTIRMSDYIVANMQAYKNCSPDYGDIAVFSKDNGFYIYRIVGKPNDTLSVQNNFLIINDKPVNTLFIKTKEINSSQIDEYREQLPNGREHLIYKFKQTEDSKMTNVDCLIIPEDSYFLMGDNRDNAYDSRYFGFVKRDQIIGKATCILFGVSFDRVNTDLNVN